MSAVVLFNKPFAVLSQFTSKVNYCMLNAAQFIKKLLDIEMRHSRTYLAQVKGLVTRDATRQLEDGVIICGYHSRICKAEIAVKSDNLCDVIATGADGVAIVSVESLQLVAKKKLNI